MAEAPNNPHVDPNANQDPYGQQQPGYEDFGYRRPGDPDDYGFRRPDDDDFGWYGPDPADRGYGGNPNWGDPWTQPLPPLPHDTRGQQFDWREFAGHPDSHEYELPPEPQTPTYAEYYQDFLSQEPVFRPRPTIDELLAVDPDSDEVRDRMIARDRINELTDMPFDVQNPIGADRALEVGRIADGTLHDFESDPDIEQFTLNGEPASFREIAAIESKADLSNWLLTKEDLAYMSTFSLDRTLRKVAGPYWNTLNEAEGEHIAEFVSWVNTRFGVSIADENGAITREAALGIRKHLIGLSGELNVMIRARGGNTDEIMADRRERLRNADMLDAELVTLPERRRQQAEENAHNRAVAAVEADELDRQQNPQPVTNPDRRDRYERMQRLRTRAGRREVRNEDREDHEAAVEAELDEEEFAEYMNRRNRFVRVLGRSATLRWLGLTEEQRTPQEEADAVRNAREERAARQHARRHGGRHRGPETEEADDDAEEPEAAARQPEPVAEEEPEEEQPRRRSHRAPSRRARRRAERAAAEAAPEAAPDVDEFGDPVVPEPAEEQPRRSRRTLAQVLRDRRQARRRNAESDFPWDEGDMPDDSDDDRTVETRY
jgi:hypothetical protein